MKLHIPFFYVALLSIGIMPQALAQPLVPISEMPRISEVEHPLTGAQWLTQQPTPTSADDSQVVKVTGVRLNQTPTGINLILDTANGATPQVVTKSSGNTLIADIPNTVLALPEGQQFRALNPVEGITSVTVTQLDVNRVRVTVTGETVVPTAEVLNARGLVLSLTPAALIERVVTATRTEEEVEDVPRAVTVITREEIEQQTNLSRNLTDILGRVTPGLGPPTQTDSNFGQSVRGRPPFVLIDGVPITSNISNDAFGRDLRSIDPQAVERIEVVRGPSAIYGDGATGGVINIITRRPSEERLTFQSEISVNAALGDLDEDSFGNFLSQSISGTEGSFDFFALLSRNRSGVFFDAESDPIPFRDEGTAETETLQALGKVGVDFDENQRLQLTANFTRDRNEPSIDTDPSVNNLPFRRKARAIDYPEPDYIGASEPETENVVLSLNYSNQNVFGSQVQAQAYYRFTEINTAYLDYRAFYDIPELSSSHDEYSEWGGRLQIDTPLFEEASLLWGVDYSNEDIFRDNIIFDQEEFDNSGGQILRKIDEVVGFPLYDVENVGLFAQFQWDVSERWLLSGGLRYEQIGVSVSDFTNADDEEIGGGERDADDVVFNAGVVFRATDELSLYANFAQGFSIPAIRRILVNAEEGFNFGRDVDLSQPQKVDNYEIGVRSEWQNVQVTLAAFYNESDLGTSFIQENPDDRFLTLERAPQRNYGVEATVDWQLAESWQLGSTVTWFDGESDLGNDGNYEALISPEASPVKVTAYVQHQTTPGWLNRLQALYVGSRDRGFEDEVDPVPIESYFVLDYISSIQIGPGALQIGIENLLDNQYFTVVNQWEGGYNNFFYFPARGRTIRLGYQITW